MRKQIFKWGLRRITLWNKVNEFQKGEVHWRFLEEIKVIAGERGIYRNKEKTSSVSQGPDGVTVSIRHTAGKYPNELSDYGLTYHYPETRHLTTDQGEINATKECIELNLPIFIILKGKTTSTKEVKLGWVVGFDDQEKYFVINFLKDTSIDLPTIKKELLELELNKKTHFKSHVLASPVQLPSGRCLWGVGRIAKGFDFLGYSFEPKGLSIAPKTLANFLERKTQLYTPLFSTRILLSISV